MVIPINHIERKPHSKKYRIVGKGVTVEFLSRFIDDPDWPVTRICENYGLTPAEVFAAWSFYYDHKEEIDRTLAEGDALARASAEGDERRKKLLKRYEKKTGHPYRGENNG